MKIIYIILLLLLFSCQKESHSTDMIIYTSGVNEQFSIKYQNNTLGEGSNLSYYVGAKIEHKPFTSDRVSILMRCKKAFRVKIIVSSKVTYEQVDTLHKIEMTIK